MAGSELLDEGSTGHAAPKKKKEKEKQRHLNTARGDVVAINVSTKHV